jgi:GH35 family endo-1,4-beta-xylanase
VTETQQQTELRIVKNFIKNMSKSYRNVTQNWEVVQDILMARSSTAGQASCIAKCRELGIDPYGYEI